VDIVTSQQYILRHGRLGLEYPNKPPILEIAGIHRTEVVKPLHRGGETVVKQAVNRLWPRDLTPAIALARPQP